VNTQGFAGTPVSTSVDTAGGHGLRVVVESSADVLGGDFPVASQSAYPGDFSAEDPHPLVNFLERHPVEPTNLLGASTREFQCIDCVAGIGEGFNERFGSVGGKGRVGGFASAYPLPGCVQFPSATLAAGALTGDAGLASASAFGYGQRILPLKRHF